MKNAKVTVVSNCALCTLSYCTLSIQMRVTTFYLCEILISSTYFLIETGDFSLLSYFSNYLPLHLNLYNILFLFKII